MQTFIFESDAGVGGRSLKWAAPLDSVQDARIEAVRTLGELLRDDGPTFWACDGARMTVSLVDGEPLFHLVVNPVIFSDGDSGEAPAVARGRMIDPDAAACRRALWEMREIAAAASLEDSAMTDQEALHTLAAIAAWVEAEAPLDGAGCGSAIRLLQGLTDGVDIDALDDREALNLFRQVRRGLET